MRAGGDGLLTRRSEGVGRRCAGKAGRDTEAKTFVCALRPGPTRGDPSLPALPCAWRLFRAWGQIAARALVCSSIRSLVLPFLMHVALLCFLFLSASLLSPRAQSVTLHTSLGDLKLELYCEDCPRTCENFLALCASGAYDGTSFHRNVKGFIVQGGDPTGTGKGGRSIYADSPDGTFPDEIRPHLKHASRGVLSMANKGPDTNTSQFFFTYKAQPHLDGKNAVFGRLIGGGATLDRMERSPVGKKYRPVNPILIDRVTIHANPIADNV